MDRETTSQTRPRWHGQILHSTMQDPCNRSTSNLVPILALFAASSDDTLSREAVITLAAISGLTETQASDLLFSTPISFPVHSNWAELRRMKPAGHELAGSHSICEQAVTLLSKPSTHHFAHIFKRDELENSLTYSINTLFLGCLVNVFSAARPSVVSRFPFFSPTLVPSPPKGNIWNADAHPSTLSSLDKLVRFSTSCVAPDRFMSSSVDNFFDEGTMARLHLLPFLSSKGQTSCLRTMSFDTLRTLDIEQPQKEKWVEMMLEFSLSSPINTSSEIISTVRSVARSVLQTDSSDRFRRYHDPGRDKDDPPKKDEIIIRVRKKMKEASNNEKWNFLPQLNALDDLKIDELMALLKEAETDEQLITVLSIPLCRSLSIDDLSPLVVRHLRRIITIIQRNDENEMTTTAYMWMAETTEKAFPLKSSLKQPGYSLVDEEWGKVILRMLEAINAARREGVEEGRVVTVKRDTRVLSCLSILRFQLRATKLDPQPFLPVLASLALADDPILLSSLLLIFQDLSHSKQPLDPPFSLETYTIPFSPSSSIPPKHSTLLSIITSTIFSTLFVASTPHFQNTSFYNFFCNLFIDETRLYDHATVNLARHSFANSLFSVACDLVESQSPSSTIPFPTNLDPSILSTRPPTKTFAHHVWDVFDPFLDVFVDHPNQPHFELFAPSLLRLISLSIRTTDEWTGEMSDHLFMDKSVPVVFAFRIVLHLFDYRQNQFESIHSQVVNAFCLLFVRIETLLPNLLDYFERKTRQLSHRDSSDQIRIGTKMKQAMRTLSEEGLADRCECGLHDAFHEFLIREGANVSIDPIFVHSVGDAPHDAFLRTLQTGETTRQRTSRRAEQEEFGYHLETIYDPDEDYRLNRPCTPLIFIPSWDQSEINLDPHPIFFPFLSLDKWEKDITPTLPQTGGR
ncbi:hypothetical protein BLNAU_8303 [Blattamonas nauphoetae]|uniref:Uncharacterized protein n=1 Tax=Blattamonas nauphoetae TaxID=2049346 RepID=A0ABQ9XYX3_9EUKA|nr:hypothetical protein BLNAU_8303 [Blattamonas nauphoetae]